MSNTVCFFLPVSLQSCEENHTVRWVMHIPTLYKLPQRLHSLFSFIRDMKKIVLSSPEAPNYTCHCLFDNLFWAHQRSSQPPTVFHINANGKCVWYFSIQMVSIQVLMDPNKTVKKKPQKNPASLAFFLCSHRLQKKKLSLKSTRRHMPKKQLKCSQSHKHACHLPCERVRIDAGSSVCMQMRPYAKSSCCPCDD